MIFISYCLSILLGLSVSAWALRNVSFPLKTGFWISSSILLGIGISSAWFIMGNLLGLPVIVTGSLETILTGIAVFFCIKNNWYPTSSVLPVIDYQTENKWIVRLLFIVFGFALLSSLTVFFYETAKFNHGEWDAWSHWNLRAKYIVRAPDTWPFLFQYISHGDYPLFNSGYVARGWAYSNTESIAVPITLAFLSTYSTISLLVITVWSLRGTILAFTAGLFLLATPFFTIVGKYQFADTPLSFFILASIAALAIAASVSKERNQLLFYSGLMMGMATWTKNEGLLFALAGIGSAIFIGLFYSKQLKAEAKWLLYGLLPMLLVTLAYKYFFGPANDMTEGLKNTGGIMPKITDTARYKYITDWFITEGATFGRWFTNPWPYIVGFLLIIGISNPKNYWMQVVVLAIIGQVVLYYVTYLLSFQELYYHLSTSFYRLCFQVFPALVLVLFVLLKSTKVMN